MSKPYEIEITETRIITTRCMVEADDWSQARAKALKGEVLLQGEPQAGQAEPERTVTESVLDISRGSSLKRVKNALGKPHAFTIHARIWTSEGLGPKREYAVVNVGYEGRQHGITLFEFPDGERRFVPESHIFDLRIESESDEISYEVSGIRYDTDGGTAIVDLPDELEIDLPADTEADDVEEMLSEAISERTGWCHKGFEYEVAA